MGRSSRFALSFAAIPALAIACVGSIDEPGPDPADATGGGVEGHGPARLPANAQLRFTCGDARNNGLTNPAIRRLSRVELLGTLQALLGDGLFGHEQVQRLLQGIPEDDLKDKATDFAPLHPADYAVTLMGVAAQVGEILEANAAEQQKMFGACAVRAPIEAACVAAFVKSFGARVYRRPLTPQEEAEHVGHVQRTGGGLGGLRAVLFRLLQSPALAFHLELGSQVTGNRTRLTDHEVASRLSYLTIGGPPDLALGEAAARPGELQKPGAIKAHVERLLNGAPGGRARVRAFFNYYAHQGDIPDPFQGAGSQNKIVTAGLGEELERETIDYTEHMFWTRKADFRALMTSRDAFPRSEALRFILGAAQVVGPDGAAVPADAEHLGLLHRPAVLASVSPRTSPILRGAHVRIRYLCDPVPEPPTDLVNEALTKLVDLENRPNRAKTELLTSGPVCAGCHAQINSLGYPFERFDQVGVAREREVAMDADGKVIGTFDIDTRISDPRVEANEAPSTSMADSRELVLAIAGGSKGRSCFAQRAVEFVRARPADESHDGCALSATEAVAHTGSLKDVLVQAIANDDIFWRQLGK